MAYTVLVTAPKLHPSGVRRLEQSGCRVLLLQQSRDQAEVERLMAEHPIDAVISRTLTLSAAAIDACPTLKVVSKHGVGVNNIDVKACSRRGIPVYVTPGANGQSVAEMALALMLAAARRLLQLDSEIRASRWTRLQDGVQLQGRILGIVGFGHVGQKLAHFCQAIGMKVVAYDPFITGASPVEGVAMLPSLDDLLRDSDIVSLHMPLTPETRGVIDARRLALMPKGSILINTARGEVIDEQALIEALRTGQLFAAGLDTMAVEPLPPDSPLRELENVVLAPHVGGSTSEALAAMAYAAADNVVRYLNSEPVDVASCVNPEVLLTPTATARR